MPSQTTRPVSPNYVVNGSAATGTRGWSAHSAAGAVSVRRLPGPQPASPAVIEVSRAGGKGSWAFAHAALAAPQTTFQVGRTYRMRAWVRAPRTTGQGIGLLLADGRYRNRPTEAETHIGLGDHAWHMLSRTFVCTARGSAETALYFKLPNSGAFTFHLTGATVQEVAAPLPRTVPAAPARSIAFLGSRGAPPDPATWRFETGGGGWGNGELQTYTARTANAQLDGAGRLQLTARQERFRGADRVARDFTSARLTTEGKVVVAPGSYVEASIVAPTGAGVWPAFWLAGANFASVGWPAAGELDIFEGWGADPAVAHSAIHLGARSDPRAHHQYGWNEPGGTVDLGQNLGARAHLYGVYFDGQVVRFYIDRRRTMTVWAEDATIAGAVWPFGQPQHMLLNIAVPNGTHIPAPGFPKTMTVAGISVWNGGIPFS